MRRSNREVFNETYDLANGRTTSAEFNDYLGSSDKLVVQYRAVAVAGTTPTLTVKLEGSNNGVDWTNLETLINAVSLTAGIINAGFGTSTVDIPAFARLAITMSGSGGPSCELQLIACGRDAS